MNYWCSTVNGGLAGLAGFGGIGALVFGAAFAAALGLTGFLAALVLAGAAPALAAVVFFGLGVIEC